MLRSFPGGGVPEKVAHLGVEILPVPIPVRAGGFFDWVSFGNCGTFGGGNCWCPRLCACGWVSQVSEMTFPSS